MFPQTASGSTALARQRTIVLDRPDPAVDSIRTAVGTPCRPNVRSRRRTASRRLTRCRSSR
jgi:hypothetical protein